MRRWLLVLALGSVLLGAGLRFWQNGRRPVLAAPLPTATIGRPRWTPLWSTAVPEGAHFQLAPDGTVAYQAPENQIVLLRERDGKAAWSAPLPPLARAFSVVRGGLVLTYCPRNPSLNKVWILRGPEKPVRAFDTDGSVWSVTSTLDGEQALIGTSSGRISQHSLLRPVPPKTWEIGAKPEFLVASTDGSEVLVGTWLPAGIRRLGGWSYLDPDSARWQEIQVSADGVTAVALSGHGPRRQEKLLRLAIYDPESGIRLWESELPGTEARVQLSADGQRVAVSYLTETGRGPERRLRILDRSGTPLCEEKGGRFLSPRLAAISALGQRITVLDGDRALFVLDSQGNTLWRFPFESPVPVVEALSSPDGTYLLLVRADHTITLYKATE